MDNNNKISIYLVLLQYPLILCSSSSFLEYLSKSIKVFIPSLHLSMFIGGSGDIKSFLILETIPPSLLRRLLDLPHRLLDLLQLLDLLRRLLDLLRRRLLDLLRLLYLVQYIDILSFILYNFILITLKFYFIHKV
jgi:hypothetical protein